LHTPEQALEVGEWVEHAIDDLRTVAHGIYPQGLADGGVGAALTEVSRRSPLRTSVLDGWSGRHSEAVEDDGPGFDASAVSGGSGLTNLLDRVTAVGGTLEIDSAPGRGTRIRGELPGGAA
jgi:signal transduction histidine kinase